MSIEETLKTIEISANLLADRWNCLYCQGNELKYIPFDNDKEIAEQFCLIAISFSGTKWSGV